MCLMLQGEKQMLVGERVLRYGAGCYVQVGTTIPVSGQVVRASEAEPYYGIRVDLDPNELASFPLGMLVPMPLPGGDLPLVSVEIAGAALLEAFERLLRLDQSAGGSACPRVPAQAGNHVSGASSLQDAEQLRGAAAPP